MLKNKNSFLVMTHDGKEYHFKHTIKAFDSDAKISPKDDKFIVETSKLSIEEIRSFTSVADVSLALWDKWVISFDKAIDSGFTNEFVPGNPACFTLEDFVRLLNDNISSGKILSNSEIKVFDGVSNVSFGHYKNPILTDDLIKHYNNSISVGNNHVSRNPLKVEYTTMIPRTFSLNWGAAIPSGTLHSTPSGARSNNLFYIQKVDMTDPQCVFLTVR